MGRYYIADHIEDEYLINEYGFKVEGIRGRKFPYGSLEYTDKETGMGVDIWWSNRAVQISFGENGDYGCGPIPKVLYKMISKGEIVWKNEDDYVREVSIISDVSEEDTITKSDSAVGSHFVGNLCASYKDLVVVFGEPHFGKSGDNKVQCEWQFEFQDG